MRVQYCSDLHLEVNDNSNHLEQFPLEIKGEVLILAGDIIPLHDSYFNNSFFSFLARNYRQVFWVPGNHEFFYNDVASYSSTFRIQVHENIVILNNKEEEYAGIRFIFSTLWSEISAQNERAIEQGLPDFDCIQYENRKLRTSDISKLHRQSLDFLSRSLATQHAKTVVVTHHMPAIACNSRVSKISPLNEAFCSDLSDLIRAGRANFWIYGHSHYNAAPLIIGQTLLLTNQLGYIHLNEHLSFRRNAYFAI